MQSFEEGESGWLREAIGGAIGITRGETEKRLRAEIAELRDELKATTAKLHERTARLPLVKSWDADEISYCGDVVTHDGSVWQAKKDTGKEPGHSDWILLARAGRDGCDGRTPRFRGAFDVGEKYAKLDVVRYDIGAFVAVRDLDPGTIPGDGDGWQLLTLHGGRGPEGETGPRGRKGERGARGEATPTIVAWTLDPVHYRAVPTMSDGRAGAPLELQGLFERFNEEAILTAVDGAMQDAAREPKLLWP